MKKLKVNSQKCKGCRYCEAACSLVHNRSISPALSRIRVNSLPQKGEDVPVVCRQCADPLCLKACLFGAIAKNELGIPVVDESVCRGCKACVEACPFQAMFFDTRRMVALKCDLCGGDPVCAKVCPETFHDRVRAIQYEEGKGR